MKFTKTYLLAILFSQLFVMSSLAETPRGEYEARATEKIIQNLEYTPVKTGSFKSNILVDIRNDGSLAKNYVTDKRKGHIEDDFDRSCLEAVRKSAPFERNNFHRTYFDGMGFTFECRVKVTMEKDVEGNKVFVVNKINKYGVVAWYDKLLQVSPEPIRVLLGLSILAIHQTIHEI